MKLITGIYCTRQGGRGRGKLNIYIWPILRTTVLIGWGEMRTKEREGVQYPENVTFVINGLVFAKSLSVDNACFLFQN